MRNRLFSYVFIFILSFPFTIHAQSDSTEVSSKIKLFPSQYGTKKWKFVIGLDARRSFLSGLPVKLNGLKIGAEYKGVHRFGIGLYWLNRNAVFTDIIVDEPDASTDPEVHFNLGYTSLFYERVFLKTRWWEIALPIHLGGGSIRGNYRDTANTLRPLVDKSFSALAFSNQIKFYPLTWLAIRVSGGYRLTFNTTSEIKQAFNRPFYGFGLSINVVELYKKIFKGNKKNEKKLENQGD